MQPCALTLLSLKKKKVLKVDAALVAALGAPIAPKIKQKTKKQTLKVDAALDVALGAPIAPTPLIPVLLLRVREGAPARRGGGVV